MWWEVALVGTVVAACAATLLMKFVRSMQARKDTCSCAGCPARRLRG